MKSILSITLIASLLLFVNAADDGAKCIKATRNSIFPYGDERARSDFCVRMGDIVSGFSDAGSMKDLCNIKEDLIAQAVNATQNIVFSTDENGVVTANDTSAVQNAYDLFHDAIDCTEADISKKSCRRCCKISIAKQQSCCKNIFVGQRCICIVEFFKSHKRKRFCFRTCRK